MAPDKIYLHKIRDEESSGYHKMWFEQSARCVPSEAYIRKDALMEWANDWLAFKRSGVVLDDGFSYAMEELIKKLNEM